MSENQHVAFDVDLCRNNPNAAAERISDLEWALRGAAASIAEALKVYASYDTHKMDIDAYENMKAARFTILRLL